MKETPQNLQLVLSKLQLSQIPFTICSDFAALMPMFGCMGSSSSHPCLYCPLRRYQPGGNWGKEEVELRTLGSLADAFKGWVGAKAIYKTEFTQKFESTVGEVLVWGVGDTRATSVLEKASPPGVHLLLSVNDVFDPHACKYFDGKEGMMEVMRKEIGVIPHSYQGKEGAFEGPQCAKILDRLDLLIPYFERGDAEHGDAGNFVLLLQSFKAVKNGVFGVTLAKNYKEILEGFAWHLKLAVLMGAVRETPKLHVISTHVLQWCEATGAGLARANEAAVEAGHHVWWETWKDYKVTFAFSSFEKSCEMF